MAIIGLIMAGLFALWKFMRLTVKEIRRKAGEKLAIEGGKKWMMMRLKDIAKGDTSANTKTMAELDRLADEEGHEYATALFDENGEIIGDIELTEKTDRNATDSPEVQKLFRNGQPLIVEK